MATYVYCPDCSAPKTRLRRVGVSKRNLETYYVCPSCDANWTLNEATSLLSYGADRRKARQREVERLSKAAEAVSDILMSAIVADDELDTFPPAEVAAAFRGCASRILGCGADGAAWAEKLEGAISKEFAARTEPMTAGEDVATAARDVASAIESKLWLATDYALD